MVAALIFVISAAALAQFVVFTWRASLLSMAEQPFSEEICRIAGICANAVGPKDFQALSSLHELCPGLKRASREMWLVRTYYSVVRALGWLGGTKSAGWSGWANREMAACARYVAVAIDQRLQSNRTCLAQVRSY